MKRELINNTESLKNILLRPKKFFILAGSAISGVCYPNTPMVTEVLATVLEDIYLILSKSSDYGIRIIGEYARELALGTKKNILKSTKFEAFLGFIEECTNKKELQKLLRIIYYCSNDEFGYNQKAIAWLIRKGFCAGCLTTNFDNSIELAIPEITRYCHPQTGWISKISSKKPFLYKLHGDAKLGNCISTNRQISKSKLAASHHYLETMIRGQTLWTLGYSGFGDLDISMHIKCKTLLWGIHRKEVDIPENVDHPVLTDLSSSDTGNNLLLGLAQELGFIVDTTGSSHSWKENVRKWCTNQKEDHLARIVVLTLFGQTNWPLVHVLNVAPKIAIYPQRSFDKGLSCLQVSAYNSALPFFSSSRDDKNANKAEIIRAQVYLGFCLWRLGKLDEAMDLLFTIIPKKNFHNSGEVENELANGIRIYLEIARDQLILTNSKAKRKEITTIRKLGSLSRILIGHKLKEIKTDLLNRIVIAQIQFLNRNKRNTNYMHKLFEDAISLQEYGVADACARAITTMNLSLGLKTSWRIQGILRTRGQINQIRKNNVTLIYALTGGIFPLILNIGDGPLFSKLFIHKREKEYQNFINIINKEKLKGKLKCH